MIVSHFNSYLRGGASTAAQQLHDALRGQGVDSRFQFLDGQRSGKQPDGGRDGYFETRWHRSGRLRGGLDRAKFRLHRERFKRSLRRGIEGAEIFTSPHGSPRTPWPPIGHPAADTFRSAAHLIHFHWIAKWIDLPSFFASLDEQQPVVWTLHDMNPLSGGCHFSGGCQRFRGGCGNCPQLRRPADDDISAQHFATKQRALAGKNLHVVAPSRWLVDLAKSSPLLAGARSFTRIPYGMPADRLYPEETAAARSALGIDPNHFVLCFGAMDLSNRRKGSSELITALAALRALPDVTCLVFGSGQIDIEADAAAALIHVGHVTDDVMRRRVYSAADVFVLPSTEDNLPLTGLEAMACGTPVVGFDAGGIPDYVIAGETGLLAENGNADQLGQRLLEAVDRPEAMRAMGHRARRLIRREFESGLEASRYIRLYQDILQHSEDRQHRAA